MTFDTVFIISLLATLSAVAGNILIIYKRKAGYVIWSISNALWIIVSVLSAPNIPQILMYIFYIAMNVIGFIKWNKDDKQESRKE